MEYKASESFKVLIRKSIKLIAVENNMNLNTIYYYPFLLFLSSFWSEKDLRATWVFYFLVVTSVEKFSNIKSLKRCLLLAGRLIFQIKAPCYIFYSIFICFIIELISISLNLSQQYLMAWNKRIQQAKGTVMTSPQLFLCSLFTELGLLDTVNHLKRKICLAEVRIAEMKTLK